MVNKQAVGLGRPLNGMTKCWSRAKKELESMNSISCFCSDIGDVDGFMMTHIISPLCSLDSPNEILFILVDGLDECKSLTD